MLILLFAILLAVVSVAAFPCWSYSARWSHLPCTVAGFMLLCIAMIAIGGKPAPKAAETDRAVLAASHASLQPEIAYQ